MFETDTVVGCCWISISTLNFHLSPIDGHCNFVNNGILPLMWATPFHLPGKTTNLCYASGFNRMASILSKLPPLPPISHKIRVKGIKSVERHFAQIGQLHNQRGVVERYQNMSIRGGRGAEFSFFQSYDQVQAATPSVSTNHLQIMLCSASKKGEGLRHIWFLAYPRPFQGIPAWNASCATDNFKPICFGEWGTTPQTIKLANLIPLILNGMAIV